MEMNCTTEKPKKIESYTDQVVYQYRGVKIKMNRRVPTGYWGKAEFKFWHGDKFVDWCEGSLKDACQEINNIKDNSPARRATLKDGIR